MVSMLRAFKSKELPENYFRAIIIMLRYCGLELEKFEGLAFSVFSKLLLIFVVYLYTFMECCELIPAKNDMDKFTDIVNFATTHIIGIFKITHLYVNRQKFKHIMQSLHQGLYEPSVQRGGEAEPKLVRQTVRTMEIYLGSFSFLVFLVFLSGFLDALHTYFTKPPTFWHMPFIPITIVDISYTPMFELAFIFQCVACIIFAAYIIGCDMLRINIMAHLSCQFKLLQNALRNAKVRAVEMHAKNPGKTLEQCFDKILKNCVKHHLGILEFARQLEELVSLVILSIFLSSVLQLCFLLFQASLVAVGSPNFLHHAFYWTDICAMLGMYCYMGNEITDEATNVLKAITDLDWTEDTSLSSKKALVLIIQRSQKPLHLTAGGFVPLSLQTFMTIVKGSFSYYMVLKQLNDQ